MQCQWVLSDFGQPVYWSSGLCSCVVGEFVWYVLLWNLLALGGAWFHCRYGGIWWAPVDWCYLESGVLWCSQDLDLSLWLLIFSHIFTVAWWLLHLYSTTDKTSPFEDNGLLFWVTDVLCGIQKLFCGFSHCSNVLLKNLWRRKLSPRPIPLSS